MSSVRMCDKCRAIFSENEEGWTTMAGSRTMRDKNGNKRQEQTAIDFCVTCSNSTFGNTEEPPVVPAVEGHYDRRYTEQLERENGLNG